MPGPSFVDCTVRSPVDVSTPDFPNILWTSSPSIAVSLRCNSSDALRGRTTIVPPSHKIVATATPLAIGFTHSRHRPLELAPSRGVDSDDSLVIGIAILTEDT